ncbi:UDP-galactopyranose mutase [Aneurinibacillus sp. UBA3580]|jgi:UDP-galactopyranose mutase|uniref:UDP-galactopyranose mutase n=1 Tax=Aneurinibacillus sp. UBA3580 TaxID=1946041 RepID=UPI002579C89A|nr:UDP-galactopyranose mutase [Aneurinibacillus sp. UBA3580]
MFSYIIVGAGFAGAVLAERIARELDEKVLVIEKRNHIAGNAYDRYNADGLMVHQYGPHIFHTRIKEVWEYLSQFTEWRLYHHRVLGVIDGKKVPIPFNLNTLHEVFPSSLAQSLEEKLIGHFGYNVKVPILKLREADDEQLKFLADYIYEKVFLHYTMKQWGVTPEEMDPAVTGRVPVYISRDDRYFQDAYQAMPQEGYTRMFEQMLDHPNIKLMLNTNFNEVLEIKEGAIFAFDQEFTGKLIYTGMIDELFDYKYGELPYRSLRFEFSTLPEKTVQEVGTVNYPNDYTFTRITEFKHLTGQMHPHTTIVKEYPQPYNRHTEEQSIPYYPYVQPEPLALYEKYKAEAREYPQLLLVGRLAEYRYYDMDAVVAKALKVFRDKIAQHRE